MPSLFAIVEHTDNVKIFLDVLFELEEESCKRVVALVSDCTKVFENAWMRSIGQEMTKWQAKVILNKCLYKFFQYE